MEHTGPEFHQSAKNTWPSRDDIRPDDRGVADFPYNIFNVDCLAPNSSSPVNINKNALATRGNFFLLSYSEGGKCPSSLMHTSSWFLVW
jgi:hypothetical protein